MKTIRIPALVLCCAWLFTGCTAPSYPPTGRRAADLELRTFRDLFLQGRFCGAEAAFQEAVHGYTGLDAPCDGAEAYLQRYLFLAYLDRPDPRLLAEARTLAALDPEGCVAETARIDAYQRGDAPVPAGGTDPLCRSVRLRRQGKERRDPALLTAALEIDRQQGWRAFVYQDLVLLARIAPEEERHRYQQRLALVAAELELACLPGEEPAPPPLMEHGGDAR